LATAKLLIHKGKRKHVDRWKKRFDRATWLTGSIDWLYHDGRIDDLKTGAWPVDPEDNKQLLSYSLVPWIKAGMPLMWEREVTITQWPRYPLPNPPTKIASRVTGLQLMEHLEDLRWSARNPTKVIVAPRSGAPGGKLHPCDGCECRQDFPPSQWMQNFWFRTFPACAEGLASIAVNVTVLPED
jgi:hypothetical protein